MQTKASDRVLRTTAYTNPTPTAPSGYAEDPDFQTLTSPKLNSANNWDYIFPPQPKYSPDGQPYYYYVVEKEWSPEEYVIGSYSAEHGITQDGTITVTNLAGSLKIQKTVTVNGQAATADNASLINGVFSFTVAGGSPVVTKNVTITFESGTATSATVDGTAVTVSNGVVQVNRLKPGTYTVTEDTTTPGSRGFVLVGEGTQTVEVTVGESATIPTVSFTNNKNLVDINIEKNDGRGSGLAGAVFQLKSVSSNGMAESLATEIGGIEGIGTVTKQVDGTNKTFESAFETTDGVKKLSKLPDGTYRLYEVLIPDGYICTFRYIQFSIENRVMKNVTTDAGDSDKLQYTAAEGNNLALLKITNEAGAELPNSGGSGTCLYTILGTVLIAFAGILLVRRQRIIR